MEESALTTFEPPTTQAIRLTLLCHSDQTRHRSVTDAQQKVGELVQQQLIRLQQGQDKTRRLWHGCASAKNRYWSACLPI